MGASEKEKINNLETHAFFNIQRGVKLISGTKFLFLFSLIIQISVASYIFLRFFYEIEIYSLATDIWAFLFAGLYPVYHIILFRGIVKNNF